MGASKENWHVALNFDEDVAGAILEWGVYFKCGNSAQREAWTQANIRRDPGCDPWRAAALEKTHLFELLRQGRDPADVRRKLDRAFMKLEIEHLIEPFRRDDNLSTTLREVTVLGRELVEEDSHIEYLGGLPVVVERWKSSVAKIYNTKGPGIGTGFLVAPRIIVTADHVVADLPNFELQFEDGDVVQHAKVVRPVGGLVDVALVELCEDVAHHAVRLALDRTVLDEVVVLGYPPVPRSDDAYLLANRGEVSAADVRLYSGQQVIIVSCLLRGGYSGGPVLNRRGRAVGLASETLFKKLAEDENSLNEGLGFAALLPSEWIEDMLSGKIESYTTDTSR